MKLTVKLLLILFVAFLSAPTIVSLIKEKVNTSCVYGLSEEEHIHKQLITEIKFDVLVRFINLSNFTSSLILSENLSKHDKIASSIFLPPPDLI